MVSVPGDRQMRQETGMEFRMLGPFEAWHEGNPVDLGDRQQRYALVVLLLHANRPISADRLIDIVWGDNRPKSNLVINYITRIRKSFRDSGATDVTIERTPTGYLLRVEPQQLDTVRFVSLCQQAADAKRSGDRSEATRLLHAGVELWRGRFLEDLDIDRIGDNEVISLDEAHLDALADLAELELSNGNHRWVRDQLRPFVIANPARQPLALLLMRALLAGADNVEAIRIYHLVRETLDEFGMNPSIELRNLAWRAHHGEPRNALPSRPPRFTGRGAELAAIAAASRAAAEEPQVVWVSGPPGVGKTALATEAAHRQSGAFGDGQLFVALNGFTPNLQPTTPAEALAQLLLDLGVPPEQVPATLNGRIALYRARLGGTRTLLVLDNAATEDQVRPLLPDVPGCLAIVTSRRLGDLDSSVNLRVAPLPLPDAADMFRNLVDVSRVRGRSAEIDAVVERCGRLPLQIRVMASQFRRHNQWPLEHLVQLLAETGPWQGGNAGATACLVSYRQLPRAHQQIFGLFAALPSRDLNAASAAALAGCDLTEARAQLDDLHMASLLEEDSPGRYHMLDPLREFAGSLPADRHEAPAAYLRLLDYYLVATNAALTKAFPFDRYPQPIVTRKSAVLPEFTTQRAALDWLSAERANLVAAVKYAAQQRQTDHAWQLAVLLWRYFNTTSHIEDWLETLELAKDLVMGDPDSQYGQAHVLLRLSVAHRRAGRISHGLELAAQALPRWVRLGDERGAADTLCAIAMATMELGDHKQAVAHYEAAMTSYQRIDDKRGRANAVSMIGHLNYQHGEFALAEGRQLEAVTLLREVGHSHGLAHALNNLGSARQRLGRLDEALANHTEALALAREMGDRCVEAYALNYLGTLYRVWGRLDHAVACQKQASAVAETVRDAHLRTQLHLDRGETAMRCEDVPAALLAYRTALELAGQSGDRCQLAHANRGVAQALHLTQDHQRAAGFWHTAEAEFRKLEAPEADVIRRERAALSCLCAAG